MKNVLSSAPLLFSRLPARTGPRWPWLLIAAMVVVMIGLLRLGVVSAHEEAALAATASRQWAKSAPVATTPQAMADSAATPSVAAVPASAASVAAGTLSAPVVVPAPVLASSADRVAPIVVRSKPRLGLMASARMAGGRPPVVVPDDPAQEQAAEQGMQVEEDPSTVLKEDNVVAGAAREAEPEAAE